MTRQTLFRPVIHVDSLSSTMDLLSSLEGDGATPGTTVVADTQSAGRGRAGRTWTAPPGKAVLMSVLLKPPRPIAECGMFALLTGLAVVRAVDAHIDSRCEIKWPNDVLIDGRKVAGILISARAGSTPRSSILLVGIGINVATSAADLPSSATSVQQQTTRPVARADIFDRTGIALERLYSGFCTGQIDDALADVDDRLAFRGQQVTVEDGPREIHGRLRGVNRDGALVLDMREGGSVVVRSGELMRGPRPTRS